MKLSIITICRNEAKAISKTLESVTGQNYEDFEYLVLDGASTDGTVDIIRKYLDKIDFFSSEKDGGIYNAMNKGIKRSRGEYLLFLNGGDYLHDNNVLKSVFSGKISEDIIFGDLAIGELKTVQSFADFKPDANSLFNGFIPHPAAFVKRELFEKCGLYDESYKIAGDYEFFLRVILKYGATTWHIPKVISIYDQGGISSRKTEAAFQKKERRMAQKKNYGFIEFYGRLLLSKIQSLIKFLTGK